jgi:hypothetical protein
MSTFSSAMATAARVEHIPARRPRSPTDTMLVVPCGGA